MRKTVYAVILILAIYTYADVKHMRDVAAVSNEWSILRQDLNGLSGKMCARKPQIPYQLGCVWYPMPIDSVFEKCEQAGVEFVIFTEIERLLRPGVFSKLVAGKIGNYKPIKSTDYYILLELKKKGE